MNNLFQHIDTVFVHDITPKNYPLGLDYTTINIAILILNLLISVWINFLGYRRRRKSDRKYQMSFDLYKNLIINNFTSFISHIWKVEDILLKNVNSTEEKEKHLVLIENSFEKIEEIQGKFYREKLPFIISFSPQMGDDIKKITEIFYDKVGDLLSQMYMPLPSRNKKLLALFGQQRDFYNNNFYNLIKKYQPSA